MARLSHCAEVGRFLRVQTDLICRIESEMLDRCNLGVESAASRTPRVFPSLRLMFIGNSNIIKLASLCRAVVGQLD